LQKGCDGVVYQGHIDRMNHDVVYREQQLRERIGDDTQPITSAKAIQLLAAIGVFCTLAEVEGSAVGFPIAQKSADYSYTVAALLILIGFICGWAANTAYHQIRNWLTRIAVVTPVPESEETDNDDDNEIPVHLTAAGRTRVTKTIPQVNRSAFENMPPKCHYYATGKTMHLYKMCAGNNGSQPVGIISICLHCRRQLARNIASGSTDSMTE
jgi:hypothetical protein